MKTDTRGRIRTPAADRDALLALYDQSSMSGAAFARCHGLRYPTFMSWLKRRERAVPVQEGVPVFREVVMTPPACPGLILELPLGVRANLERADQLPMIAALALHLREAAPC
jgi:hypothetical protein